MPLGINAWFFLMIYDFFMIGSTLQIVRFYSWKLLFLFLKEFISTFCLTFTPTSPPPPLDHIVLIYLYVLGLSHSEWGKQRAGWGADHARHNLLLEDSRAGNQTQGGSDLLDEDS